jgi:hypothetical protein
MRPDKISYRIFGTTAYTDAILKINKIFNPFSIKEGDILVIPNLSNPGLHYKSPADINKITANENDVRDQFSAKELVNKKDKGRIERIAAKAKKKKAGVNTPLPPNVLPSNKKAKEFKKGRIILGANLNNPKKRNS